MQHYQWDSENQREINKQIASQLLGDNRLFLQDGVDGEVSRPTRWTGIDVECSQGKTNNFAHPALAGLVVDVFYNGDKMVGKLFLEVFWVEVPRVTVAIAATVIMYTLTPVTCS